MVILDGTDDIIDDMRLPAVTAVASELIYLPDLLMFHRDDAMRAWPLFAEHVADIERFSRGRYTPETAKDAVANGTWMLWGIVQGSKVLGCAITEFLTYPTGLREMFVVWVGGSGMSRWIHLTAKMEEAARAAGCSRMTWYGRAGWVRRQSQRGFHPVLTVMEKEL